MLYSAVLAGYLNAVANAKRAKDQQHDACRHFGQRAWQCEADGQRAAPSTATRLVACIPMIWSMMTKVRTRTV